MAFVPANIEFLVQEWKNAPYEPSLFKAEHVNQWQQHLKEVERASNAAGELAEQVNANQAALAGGAPKGTMLVSNGTNFVQVSPAANDRLLMTDANTPNGVKWVELAGAGLDIYVTEELTITAGATAVTGQGWGRPGSTFKYKVTNKRVAVLTGSTNVGNVSQPYATISNGTLLYSAGSTGAVVPPALRPSVSKAVGSISCSNWNSGGTAYNMGSVQITMAPNGTLSWPAFYVTSSGQAIYSFSLNSTYNLD